MVGRPKKPGSIPKRAPNKTYKTRTLETRGITYKEPSMIGSFWRDHTMDQIQAMNDEELMQAIDIWLDKMIARAIKNDKMWDFPIREQYTRIASLPKK
jgi:hypothetical protein